MSLTLLRDLPPQARWYIRSVIALGALTFGLLVARTAFSPLLPLVGLVALAALFSAFKVQFPIASGSNMSLSYIVNIATVMLHGPHAAMIAGAATGLSQTTLNAKQRNPAYRTAFNMACLVLTTQAAGQVYQLLGGSGHPSVMTALIPVIGMAFTYFVVNTAPIAIAIALTTHQNAFRVWRSDFLSSAASYLLGAIAAVVVIEVTERSGYWLTLLLGAAPMYLAYKVYRSGMATEARQGAILDAAQDAIITMDPQLNIREFNPAAEQMFGYGRLEILGKHVELLLPAATRETHVRDLAQYSASGDGPFAANQLELTAVRADGTEFPVELSVARVGGDRTAFLTGFIRDVTERHALEAQLRQSQKLEAIGRLASGVAHDFNNVLMSIMGSADLLLMLVDPNDPAAGETTEIKESVRRGASLTRQLLAFSRRQASSPKLFEVGEVIAGMETMLRRLIGPEIEFAIAPRERAIVRADPAQIEQVVLNLVINARDAMPDGGRLGVRIDHVDVDQTDVVAQVEGRGGRYARISVTDTGSGIDAATRARLFEPFFTTKEQGKGTGLGLSIVYGIVRQSGGHIEVDSEPGRGTTFHIFLPLVSVPEPAEMPALEVSAAALR